MTMLCGSLYLFSSFSKAKAKATLTGNESHEGGAVDGDPCHLGGLNDDVAGHGSHGW